jgi:Ser/Thr protein kinase RdoA (MazF antagonist)
MWKKEIVQEACRKFQGNADSLRFLGGFHQNVYEYERDGERFILKLIPVAQKDESQLNLELQWISYLRSNGVRLPEPVLSENGRPVETIIRLPIPCCIISYKKEKGEKIHASDPYVWNPRLLRRIGQTMGKIHSLSSRFSQRADIPAYEEWNEGEIFYRDFSFVDGWIADRFSLFLQKVRSFPRNSQSYGLIHNDFQPGGFLVDPHDQVILFDFKHIKYHFFTYEIATLLFHALEGFPEKNHETLKDSFIHSLMEGYFLEHHLEDGWQEQVDFFLEYRLFFLYISLLTLIPTEKLNHWQKEQLVRLKSRLEKRQFLVRTE